MFASAIRTIASAAASSGRPSGAPTARRTASRAAPASSVTLPPSGRSAASVPSTRWASVSVACSPPAPYAAGPGWAPALSGPTDSAPKRSTAAIEPPPAPTESTSIWGRLTGWPAWSPLKRSCGSPPTTRAMSAVVPPMSNVSRSRAPAAAPSRAAPITPAAGPEATSPTGSSAAIAAVVTPPFDCIRCSGVATPSPSRRRASRRTYAPAGGSSAALSAVVLARTYSRTSGATALDSVTGTPGSASRSRSATRRSCAGSRNEKSSATATASTPSAASAAAAARTSSSSSGASSRPSGPIRPPTPWQRSRGITGGGCGVHRS